MSNLINELKVEHRLLTDSLNEIKSLGVLSEEGAAKLFSLKSSLLLHLHKEDEMLYPTLKKASQSDKQLESILNSFGKNMEVISGAASDFFNKYFAGVKNEDMEKDFETICHVLEKRIKREEEVLFTMALARGIAFIPPLQSEDLAQG